MSAQQEAPLHNDPSVMDYMEQAEGVGEHPVRRHGIGMVAGVIAAIIVYFIYPHSAVDTVNAISPDAEVPFTDSALRITAATAVLMGIWWMTEAIPLAATALVPLVVFPLSQTIPFGKLSGQYASPSNVTLLCIPVALAATCAFILPVATPPNAIAFGSGYVKINEMVRGGLSLNFIGIVLITIVTYFLAVPVFGLVL